MLDRRNQLKRSSLLRADNDLRRSNYPDIVQFWQVWVLHVVHT